MPKCKFCGEHVTSGVILHSSCYEHLEIMRLGKALSDGFAAGIKDTYAALHKDSFSVGELIIYQNGGRYEIGKIKSITDDGAFVWYHDGDTAAKTPFDCMHKLVNAYTITETSLGGKETDQ